MFKYYIDSYDERLFGYNFSFLMKLAAKLNPEQVKHGEISIGRLEDSFFQHKGTEKRNLIVFFSDDKQFAKYIRLSYVGNYYFGFRINIMHFLRTFLGKEKSERKFSENKFIYSYMLKNYFKNYFYSDSKYYCFESRYKDHRKTQDLYILTDKKRRENILKDIGAFLKAGINTEKEQHELIKLFLRIKKVI
jgi:hypothetical protein